MAGLKAVEQTKTTADGVTWRSLLLGLTGTTILAWLVPVFDLKVQGTWIASCHLPIGVFNLFVTLLFANAVLKAVYPSWALSRKELLASYCLMLVGSGLPSFGFTEYLFPTLAGTLYYARPENRWAELTFRYIPQWFVPWDVREAALSLGGAPPTNEWWASFYELLPSPLQPGGREIVRLFYEGAPQNTPIPLSHWVVPTATWTLLGLTFFFRAFLH
ncbi:MAG: DUF6785 family protein [Candidatus Fervidibacter sp.]|uniref:DUF6785 family protein n=1 Tax=Candidatus Fervidibacter sp. TaxID=3100871 RepID=UPI00404AB903